MRLSRRFVMAVAAAILALSGIAAFTATPAHAASGFEWSFQAGSNGPFDYINAWNGGPYFAVYNNEGAVNNDFTIIKEGSYYDLQDTGGGAWNGWCVGDAHNSPDYVITSAATCGSGWGVNFTVSSCSSYGISGYAFHNNHWDNWLNPPNNSNGTDFNLDAPTPYCFHGQPYLQPLP